MKRKIVSILTMLFAISICFAPVANAALQASLYLTSYDAYMWADGGGVVSVYFDVQGTGTMDEIGALSIRLQERANGSSAWTTIKTYSYVNYPNMLDYDNFYYGSSVSYSGKTGYSYRAYVTVWAGKDGVGDSREILTGTIVAS